MRLYEKMKNGVYIIAEMSANHGGSIETAYRIIEEAKAAGADCVKIQTYTADTMTINCDKEAFRIKGGLWDGYTYYDLYKTAYMPWEWQGELKRRCEDIGIDFLSTPFDTTAVDFLESIGTEFYKIASYELVDIPFIEYAAGKGKPMVISCGMGSAGEIQEALDACYRQENDQVVLLKCCSQYPAQYDDMNLSVIQDMAGRFRVPVGLSDHSMGSLASVMAVSLGARVIEKHVKLEDRGGSVDGGFSMMMADFREMVKDIRNAELAMGRPGYGMTGHEKETGWSCRRSLFAVRSIGKGEAFTAENVRSIRPAYGLKPKYYKELLAKQAGRDYEFGDPIAEDEI